MGTKIMRTQGKIISTHRVYSQEFKREIVEAFESGKYSVCQLARLYGMLPQNVYRWVYKFSNFNKKGVRIVEMKSSQTDKLKALEQKVKELEQSVGQKQIMIDYLEKMMEIAKRDLHIDIKKNYGIQQSTGSVKTKQK